MDLYTFTTGTTPLLVSIPHAGTYLPDAIAATLTPAARPLPDTDWHLPRLYDFLPRMGASVLTATHSRCVIDLNRDPSGKPLYPGASNTELCPTALFDEQAVYHDGTAPDAAAIAARRKTYWAPYHQRLSAELDRVRAEFGIAILFDAHSIRSVVPRFFEGRLWDINIGTADGRAAPPDLGERLLALCKAEAAYTSVLDGRFKGGYITRHYGRPDDNIHAVQLELAECTYMQEEAPYTYDPARAAHLTPLLEAFVGVMLDWAREHQS
ncbi:MAG: N-formylglutamate deformylase [Casimicrobiaceae bacterium]